MLFTFYCPCSIDLLTFSSCRPVEKLAWSFSFSFSGNCGHRAGYIDSMFTATAQSALSHYSTPRCSFKPFAVRRSALAKRQFNRRSLDVDFCAHACLHTSTCTIGLEYTCHSTAVLQHTCMRLTVRNSSTLYFAVLGFFTALANG